MLLDQGTIPGIDRCRRGEPQEGAEGGFDESGAAAVDIRLLIHGMKKLLGQGYGGFDIHSNIIARTLPMVNSPPQRDPKPVEYAR